MTTKPPRLDALTAETLCELAGTSIDELARHTEMGDDIAAQLLVEVDAAGCVVGAGVLLHRNDDGKDDADGHGPYHIVASFGGEGGMLRCDYDEDDTDALHDDNGDPMACHACTMRGHCDQWWRACNWVRNRIAEGMECLSEEMKP